MQSRPDIRCTGECCNGFTLLKDNEPETSDGLPENMDPRAAELFVFLDKSDEGLSRYTCKAWDPETKLCTVYDTRPGMCERFPHDMTCWICGATSPEEATSPPPADDNADAS